MTEALAFALPAHWGSWLAEHHEASTGLWIKFAKKASGITSINHEQALDLAIAHGWIDGQVKSFDDQYYLQRFTPRTTRSKWSKINCAKAEELIASGAMRPAGLRQVELAKADGRWAAAYAGPRTIEVHPELQEALDGNAAAREFFATLDSRNRYAILYRTQDAKKPETRTRRIEKFVAMLAAGEKIYP
jgi:uncharacterized protein YdeI (YjbR/CyaY-like superfamily)